MMDSACAEYDVLRKQKQAVGTGIQRKLILDDLCQTVYLSPQICIPAGDVDACLSTECCVSVFFRLLSKTHFFHGAIFALWRERGKDMVSLGGYCSSPLRVMHDDFLFFRTMIR